MISKPTYLTNAKLDEMYGVAMIWFFITIQAIVFDGKLMQTIFVIEFLS